jgi:hypothetical protein
MIGYRRAQSRAKDILKKLFMHFKGYRIRGVPQLNAHLKSEKRETRINLMLIYAGGFGGTDTAMRFFNTIRSRYKRSRILVVQGEDSQFDPAQWPGFELESRNPDAPHTFGYLQQPGFRPSVYNECDHFIATHWTTAHYIILLREALERSGAPPKVPFIYLIQDFEPGFYAWSSRYLFAAATYTKPEQTIAAFNTQLLKDYFEAQGYAFPASYVFEPRLNPKLASYQSRLLTHKKRRLILIYGRPSTPRNAFELVVETLFAFAESYKDAARWEILSLGESHETVSLPNGLSIKTEGKVTLDRYAQHLLDASVGLALMVSPHPSYPPLEMAEFGVRVITNRFANKDLSGRTKNIVSMADARPTALAKALADACDAFEAGAIERDTRPAFLGTEDEFPFWKDLMRRMSVTTDQRIDQLAK